MCVCVWGGGGGGGAIIMGHVKANLHRIATLARKGGWNLF